MSENKAGGSERGLYDKYEVYKDGKRVEDCFVLEPESDHAARLALIQYMSATDDQRLKYDLWDWLIDMRRSQDTDSDRDTSEVIE